MGRASILASPVIEESLIQIPTVNQNLLEPKKKVICLKVVASEPIDQSDCLNDSIIILESRRRLVYASSSSLMAKT